MKFDFLEKNIIKKSLKNKNKINKNNLYIFPNLRGFQVGALVFFCFCVSIFYQNNFALLLSIILFFVFFISILISYQNLNNLEFRLTNNMFPAKKLIELDYVVKNDKKTEKINIDLKQNNYSINLDIKENEKIKFKNKFDVRGTFDVPNIDVKSVFPFGIINTFSKIFFEEKLIVYPNPIKPPQNLLDNILQLNKEGFDYEFDKIEEDKFGQNLSKISWKHYSIKGKLYYKKFIFKKNSENLIIDIENLSDDLEKALSYASYLVNQMYDQKKLFSIKYKNYSSNMSCSYEHKKKQLTYLANV